MDCPPNASAPSRSPMLLVRMVLFSIAALAVCSNASAQSSLIEEDLYSELARMQQQIDELKNASMQPASLDNFATSYTTEPIVCCEPKPVKPKFPTARLTGFFQADAVYFDQDATNIAAVGDAQDGADFRRARLAAVGQAWDNISYQLEMDFAFPGRPSFMDVWLDIEDVILSNNLRIGQFRQPFGMDGLTSVKEMTFLERGLPFAFLPFRQIGAAMYGNQKDELATWAIAGFRYPTDVYGGNVGDNGGYGMATRLTGLLINRPDAGGLLHIGGGFSFLDPSNDQFQFRNQPEVFVGEEGGGVLAGTNPKLSPFVNTGEIDANNASLFSAELAAAHGSFYAQSEFIYAYVDQINGPSLGFSGAYAYCGYFLTGEKRPYNGKAGVYGSVKPRKSVGEEGGIGAWEIATRYSYIDLTDENINGGRLNNITAGLNWYLNPHTKFQFNYIYSMLDAQAGAGPIPDTPAGVGDSNAGIFAMRAQVDF
ncbi:phosphate-selective porin OprO/OprP [Rhodopirellula rubra]|uniref:Phosphate-selective porin OprO/OprP n=1 Tax=Aporhodopirellula rubra TaxID=980271 RepID=A0A7W5E4I4_9BACT|nr:porin [Aporhodopirellula rubra]MBB3210080.1 phosphate-selective porin OprO/OprP [Aporhodopirellula rubra]